MKHLFKLSFLALLAAVLVSGTPNEGEGVVSPADEDQPQTPKIIPFSDLYFNILETSCAHSNCHDGNFEPNFTTPQTAYNTLVLHEIIKNDPEETYQFRVLPYSPEKSLLIERISNCCTINESDRMPLLMPPLSEGQVDSIRQWIINGAPDPYNEFPHKGLY